MSHILVHNHAHPSELDARAARRTKTQVADEHYWNLWHRAVQPFDIINAGVRVLLLESWPGGAFISWEAEATNVSTARFDLKAEAVRAIAHWAGESVPWVLADPYTAAKPPDAGLVIYWRAKPVRRIDVPRPPDLKVRRNGWLVTDEEQLRAWGVPLPTPPSSSRGKPNSAAPRAAGRRLDVEARNAIEQRAMRVAKLWAKRQQWTHIKDVSRGNSQGSKSWDLEAVDQLGRTRYIEVKGTTGRLGDVEVTHPEVIAARRQGVDHSLIIVHQINLVATQNKFSANGGVIQVYNPWLPKDEELDATRYRWKRR